MSLPSEKNAIINRELPTSFNLHYKLSGETEMRNFVRNLTVHHHKSFNILPSMDPNLQSHAHSWQNNTKMTDEKLSEKKKKKDRSKCNTVPSTKIRKGGETRNSKRQEQVKHNWNETTKQPNKERTNQCQDMPRCVPPMCALARVEIPECWQGNGVGHQLTDVVHAQSSRKTKWRWRKEKRRNCTTAQRTTLHKKTERELQRVKRT